MAFASSDAGASGSDFFLKNLPIPAESVPCTFYAPFWTPGTTLELIFPPCSTTFEPIFPPCSTTVAPAAPRVVLAVLPKNDNPYPTYPNPDLTFPKRYYFLSSKSLGGYAFVSESHGSSFINIKCLFLYQEAHDYLYFYSNGIVSHLYSLRISKNFLLPPKVKLLNW